jgi:hypothetical protein
VVGGLLFLAFAYFAVGQAAANRNDAQTAADAAALAAAQETRAQLTGAWLENLLDPARWREILEGDTTGLGSTCWRADLLAARNDAHVLRCGPDGPLGYTVEVETDQPVGDSIVPGTEDKRSRATATAVIEPRCSFDLPDGEPADEEEDLPFLDCDGEIWKPDPADRAGLPDAEDLFDVHLARPTANDE